MLAGVALASRLWTLHVDASADAAGLFHDGGVYLVTARALADDAGYRVVSTPGAPPAVRYPPAYPLALSAVWRAAPRFPDNLPLLKAVGLLAAVGLIALLPGALAAAGVPPAVGTATAVLTAVAPLTVRYATAIASELPYALLALTALWLVARSAGNGRGWGLASVAGAVAGLAFLTRSIGVAVIGAGLLTLLRRADRRRAAAFALAAAPPVAGWVAWLLLQRGHAGGPGYVTALLHDGIPGPSDVLAHLVAVPAAVGLVALPGLAEVLPETAPWWVLGIVYGTGLVALGAALRRPYGAYVALTVAIAVAVPWFQPRFLVPLAPLFLAALLAGAFPASRRRAPRFAASFLVVALLLLGLAGSHTSLARVRASGLPALDDGSHTGGGWSEVRDASTWLRTHTAPDEIVASFHDPLVYLYTGRRTVQAYPSIWRPDPAQVTAALDGTAARYIVDVACPDTGTWSGSRAAWQTWLARNTDALTPVYEAPGVRIWQRRQ